MCLCVIKGKGTCRSSIEGPFIQKLTATNAWITTVKLTFLWPVIQLRILIHLYIFPKCQDFYLIWWSVVKEGIIDVLRSASFLRWNYKENLVRLHCMWTYFMNYTSLNKGLWEEVPFHLKSSLREKVIRHLEAHSGAVSALQSACWVSKNMEVISFFIFYPVPNWWKLECTQSTISYSKHFLSLYN